MRGQRKNARTPLGAIEPLLNMSVRHNLPRFTRLRQEIKERKRELNRELTYIKRLEKTAAKLAKENFVAKVRAKRELEDRAAYPSEKL